MTAYQLEVWLESSQPEGEVVGAVVAALNQLGFPPAKISVRLTDQYQLHALKPGEVAS